MKYTVYSFRLTVIGLILFFLLCSLAQAQSTTVQSFKAPLTIPLGGTGASTAAGAATNLGLGTGNSPTFLTVKLSGLTDGYVPYHSSDNVGLLDSPIYINGTFVDVLASGLRSKNGTSVGYIQIAGRSTDGQARIEFLNNAMTVADAGVVGYTGALAFNTVNTERIRINSSGQLGVGTNNPTSTVDIVQDSTSNIGLRVKNGTNPQIHVTDGTTIFKLQVPTSTGFALFGTETNHPLRIYTNNTTRVIVDTAGYVGIGITPTYPLHVKASAGNIARFENNGAIGSVDVYSGTAGAVINVRDNGGTSAITLDARNTGSTSIATQTFARNNESIFDAYSTNTGHVSRLKFRKSQQNTAGYTANSSTSYLGSLEFYGVNSGNTAWGRAGEIRVTQDGSAGATYVPGKISFLTSDGTNNQTERMAIDSYGRVGIGGAISNSKLFVNGTNTDSATTKFAYYGSFQVVSTANETSYTVGMMLGAAASNTSISNISSGVTNSGYWNGMYIGAYRDLSTDAGALASLKGVTTTYGHGPNAVTTTTTTAASGIVVTPFFGAGVISNAYDLRLAPPAYTTAPPTTHYAIYQEYASAKNYFAGNIGIGTSYIDDPLTVYRSPSDTAGTASIGLAYNTTSGGRLWAMRLSSSGNYSFNIDANNGGWSTILRLHRTSGNMGLGTTSFGTSATKTIAVGSGTAPTTTIDNGAQMWVEDVAGTAGKAGFHILTEARTTKQILAGTIYKTDTGDPTQVYEGQKCINTYDNNYKVYADGAWRTLATW